MNEHIEVQMLVERRLSAERLAPYRAAAGTLPRAIALYEWNSDVGAAFWATLGHLEVLLRNALHQSLTSWTVSTFQEPRWYTDPGRILTVQAMEDVARARRRATRDRKHETPGRVIGELGFGFWRYLLASKYERTLWVPCLREAFPHLPGMRHTVHSEIAALHDLRNRIAHHEPVHNRPLDDLHGKIMTTADWICPATRDWIASRCRVPALLKRRPS